jgi:hypothetical protein
MGIMMVYRWDLMELNGINDGLMGFNDGLIQPIASKMMFFFKKMGFNGTQ